MRWLSNFPELRRLRKRVTELERKLESERTRHLVREDALVNLVTTAHGHRGISEPSVELPKREKPRPQERTLTPEDDATLIYYKQCAKDAGLEEGVADEWFEAYLRGEEPVMQLEN